MSCQVELRGLGAITDELASLGVHMAAVSVDSPSESRRVVDRLELPFPILSDEERRLIRELGLVHKSGGPGGTDIAVPAHVLIDPTGRVLWRHTSDRIHDRLAPGQVTDAVSAAL